MMTGVLLALDLVLRIALIVAGWLFLLCICVLLEERPWEKRRDN